MTLSKGQGLALLSCVLIGAAIADDRSSNSSNLQVLPKETSAANIAKLMQRYSEDLGVSCSHCHAQNYTSDENPNKQTARVMIAMLNDINDKHLARLGRDPRYAPPVTCGSCHQGQSSPPTFEPRSP